MTLLEPLAQRRRRAAATHLGWDLGSRWSERQRKSPRSLPAWCRPALRVPLMTSEEAGTVLGLCADAITAGHLQRVASRSCRSSA